MSTIAVDELLKPVFEEQPGGEDLEYDPAFIALEEAARGKEERQIGDVIEAAEEPDWKDVARRAGELFERTKDLRVAVYLTRAGLALDGLPGLADGLRVIDGLIERYWESVHPLLDPDDDFDPVMRVNILAELTDANTVLNRLRLAPLVASRTFGRFGLRDLAIAKGELSPPEDEEVPDLAQIEGAFAEVDVEELQATAAAAHAASEALEAIERRVTEQVGVEQSISFGPLSEMLRDIGRLLDEKLGARGVAGEEAPSDDAGPAEAADAAEPAGLSGVIRSRDDVIVALERIAEYYRRYEPSSPLPLLVHRAKSLVHADFMEILRNIAPDAVAQAEFLAGSQFGEETE